MTDLVEFLRARLDEDAEIARGAIRWSEGASEWAAIGEPDYAHIARHDPARVLREVEAKRRILDEHHPHTRRASWDEDETICCTCRYDDGLDTYTHPCPTIRLLALPYADHPDYREEWKP